MPLQNTKLDQKFQTYKGRVVLGGGIVKDDSGSCAVLAVTRFVSVANDGRTSDECRSSRCSIRLYPSENGGRFSIECPDVWMCVYHNTSGPNHGLTLNNPLFFLCEIFLVTHVTAYCGKDNLQTFCWDSRSQVEEIEEEIHETR